MHTAVAHISRAALRHNLKQVRELTPGHPVMAMIKANAYGHGLVEVAEVLADADGFGVARLHEALALRDAGFQQRILLLEGIFEPDELLLTARFELDLVVHQFWQIRALEQAVLPHPIRVWLKLDSGMHRLGFLPDEIPEAFQQLSLCNNVAEDIQLMSHFCCADDVNSRVTAEQLNCFTSLIDAKEAVSPSGELSIANSAAILSYPESHLGWLRPGIMLYGASPMVGGVASDHNLEPVMTLASRVIAVRHLAAGEPVGYSGTWRSDKPTRIAVVAIGYGDGYPRHAENGTPVFIKDRCYPLAGRVSMDMITVDIGDADIEVGEAVELWGKNLSADEVARHLGTISYDLFCGLSRRVVFHYY